MFTCTTWRPCCAKTCAGGVPAASCEATSGSCIATELAAWLSWLLLRAAPCTAPE